MPAQGSPHSARAPGPPRARRTTHTVPPLVPAPPHQARWPPWRPRVSSRGATACSGPEGWAASPGVATAAVLAGSHGLLGPPRSGTPPTSALIGGGVRLDTRYAPVSSAPVAGPRGPEGPRGPPAGPGARGPSPPVAHPSGCPGYAVTTGGRGGSALPCCRPGWGASPAQGAGPCGPCSGCTHPHRIACFHREHGARRARGPRVSAATSMPPRTPGPSVLGRSARRGA